MAGGTGYVPTRPACCSTCSRRSRQSGVKQVVTDYFGESARAVVREARATSPRSRSDGWLASGRRRLRHERAHVQRVDAGLAVRRRRARARDVAAPPRPSRADCGTERRRRVQRRRRGRRRGSPPRCRRAVPVFEAGDAAIFDQFLLHSTAAGTGLHRTRATASRAGSSRRRPTPTRSAGSRSSTDRPGSGLDRTGGGGCISRRDGSIRQVVSAGRDAPTVAVCEVRHGGRRSDRVRDRTPPVVLR